MNTYTYVFIFLLSIPNYLLAEGSGNSRSIFADSELEHVFTEEMNIEPPLIHFESGHHLLKLSEKMEAALAAYNPTFKAWKTEDYTQSIVDSLKHDGENSAPFAFIKDINQDDKPDVIIDGFNGKEPETIAIISNNDDYQVKHVASLHTYSEPQKVTSMNDGVVEHGLNYLLWPNHNEKTQAVNIFTVGFPQETDSEGELLSDGGLIDFHFENGEFVPYYPEF